ncbi:abscisic acid-insensitive 5-like protein 1 [Nicotiana attenuata]|uniref:Abscisic acid-insensitive 5-like protein 1 n=1 Tax=Nicotiana attenuata TaxID=49451 RepID=A0A1J6LBG8_NICAT|nr:abscisic acid-insensitive 5-like protein 1 [Nicotiana attenuata]
MEVSENESVDYCKVNLEAESSKYHSIASSSRQNNSAFSLTLDEFQSKKGRNYGSMNLDDLLNNFWDNEGNQVTPNSNQDIPTKEGQNSRYDFLSHSKCAENGKGDADSSSTHHQIFEQVNGCFINGHQISDQITTTNKENNDKSNSASDVSEPIGNSRRRSSSVSLEATVMEKRQRRMIKNRESAARSRARKQAYTAELEIELNRLREENEKLKLLVAQVATRRKDEEEKMKQPTKAQWVANKLRRLRRMSSVSW